MNTYLKKSILLLLGLVSLTQYAFSTNNYTLYQSSGSISYLEDNYCNDLDENYTINTGSSSPVKIDYNLQCESPCDYLLIYAFNSSDNLVLLKEVTGWEAGSVTSFYSGKIKLVFYTDGSVSYADDGGCGNGFSVSFASQSGYTTASTYLFGGNTILPFGKVGIGTTTPSYKLDVNVATTQIGARFYNGGNYITIGGIGSATSYIKGYETTVGFGNSFVNGNVTLIAGNSEKLRINSLGDVGVGTTTPSAKFDIVGASNNLSLRVTNNTYNDWLLQKRRTDNTQIFGIKETGSNGSMTFVTNATDRVTVNNVGNVGIGTTSPDYKLDVNGSIRATEIMVVSPDSFPDYVFYPYYELTKLEDVDAFIQKNGHLQNIPSASEVKEKGINLVEMQVQLLQKVEELTLYAIKQQKVALEQQKRIDQLEQVLNGAK